MIYGNVSRLQLRVHVGDHALLVFCEAGMWKFEFIKLLINKSAGNSLEHEVEELLPPQAGGEVHLEVVRVDVEEEAAVVAAVVAEREGENCFFFKKNKINDIC